MVTAKPVGHNFCGVWLRPWLGCSSGEAEQRAVRGVDGSFPVAETLSTAAAAVLTLSTSAVSRAVSSNKRARTVPLVPVVVPIVDRWSAAKSPGEWLFAAPAGGPLRETNWQRSVSWREAKVIIGRPDLRVHDLRHTAASVWLASGADPKVVQRVLGHATAAMTMDLYGHMIDRNLWDAAQRLGVTSGAGAHSGSGAPRGTAGRGTG
jgi:Phage integrase family